MQRMGLEAICPKPRLSEANPEHKVYPYLLRGLKICYPNQVWSTVTRLTTCTGKGKLTCHGLLASQSVM